MNSKKNMPKYTITMHKRVEKFLASHPDTARHFIQKLALFEHNPIPIELDIKPIK